MDISRDIAIRKIKAMPQEQVSKVLIFMAGMEAENKISREQEEETQGQAGIVKNTNIIF